MKTNLKTLHAACLLALGVTPCAWAQEPSEMEEIVVKGLRASMISSLAVKRDGIRVADVVSAEDVGQFPDSNVAESLQRITGVSIDRSGGEGQFITVRGLGPEFNTVLVNQRTIATGNNGREFSFDSLSSEIISSAEVYKSAQASVQSGGIGSVVNISTARPFDYSEPKLVLSALGRYDELSESTTPELTGVGAWMNNDKTFGAMLSASYSERDAQIDSAGISGHLLAGDSQFIVGDENASGLGIANTITQPNGRIPRAFTFEREEQSRERLTVNGAIQSRPNEDLDITVDGLFSSFDIDSSAQRTSFFFEPSYLNAEFDANNTLLGFNNPGTDFYENNPLLAGPTPSPNDNVVTGYGRDEETYQVGVNLKYALSSNFEIVADISTSKAERSTFNPFIVVGSLSSTSPRFEVLNGQDIPTISNLSNIDDISAQRAHFTRVSTESIEDEIFESRLDAHWFVDAGALVKLSFGAFNTQREKSFQAARSQFRSIYSGYSFDVPDELLMPYMFDDFLSSASGSGSIPLQGFTFDIEEYFSFLNANLDAAPNQSQAQAAIAADISGEYGVYTPRNEPSQGFLVDETVTAIYFDTEWEGSLGDRLPWSANIGFRIAKTDTSSKGVDQPVIRFEESPGDTLLEVVRGPASEIEIENDYTNFLPSANFKLELTDEMILRFGYSETITRPTLTALGVGNSFGGRSFAPTSTGGNPELEAFESTNYDISYEWYFSDVGFFGAAFFRKEFEQFIETQTLLIPNDVTFDNGETRSVDFEDTRQRNGEKGSINGFEVAGQYAFDHLPGFWSGFGLGANFTYVESDIDRSVASGAQGCDYNGLSPRSYNINGFYQKDGFQARIAYNYRAAFLVQCFDEQAQPRHREEYGQLDMQVSYDINEMLQVFVEGVNLTNEQTRDYSIFNNRFLNYRETGARYSVGVRATF
ncbi:TonB-dependent receptor [Paraglaciecola chathamensis]|uniref:TonB-dependent receptor n=1 Tax=Paraglaciecola agarilytica NO2 TaxID=1125747 RepID=A0ABQ0ID47_9ALTE|nr:TonB-dependent receptor [Paraglaciecola agarilytica]GAC07294.1 hypothetical protein GAGA_4469 [Paraglaciecola agarilytica NO2]